MQKKEKKEISNELQSLKITKQISRTVIRMVLKHFCFKCVYCTVPIRAKNVTSTLLEGYVTDTRTVASSRLLACYYDIYVPSTAE